MDRDKLQTLTTLVVTLALIMFAFLLVQEAIDLALTTDRVSPETVVAGIIGLANTIVIAAVARWLQQGAAQSAERVARAAAATNGGPTDQPPPAAEDTGTRPTRPNPSGDY